LGVGRFVFRHDLRTATMQALVCAFPDMAYFGAPILAAVFGPEGFLAVLVGNLITSIFMLPLTIVLTGPGAKNDTTKGRPDVLRIFGQSITRAVINPIVWLPVSGMVLSFCHVTLPGPVLTSVDLIAKAAGGTSLFALGLMLYGERFVINANVLANLGLKNFLQPALMALGALLFGVVGAPAHQAVITGAVPTVSAVLMVVAFVVRRSVNESPDLVHRREMGQLPDTAPLWLLLRTHKKALVFGIALCMLGLSGFYFVTTLRITYTTT
jgi:malonate transporter and related proteins